MLTTEQLRPILENKYNRDDWYKILRQNFNVDSLRETPASITSIAGNEFDAKAYILGELDTSDGYKVGIYEVDTPGVKQIHRNKVGLRNLLKNVYQTDVDAALIVFTQGDKWRFSYVSEITTRNPETGDRENVKTDSKRYTYLFGKNEKVKTASDRFAKVQQEDTVFGKGTTLKSLQDTFSVEKMSKDFFNEYRRHYGAFLSYLIGENEEGKVSGTASALFKTIFNAEDKKARDFVKKMLGRIVFLYFLEKKGWMGVPENERWGKGDPDFLRNLFNACNDQNDFYSSVLEPLFHKTLNEEREGDFIAIEESLFSKSGYNKLKIPFLNGGLFETENYKTDFLTFPAHLFKNVFEFFDKYNFTVHEDSPEEHTVAVDPEMLGHIFENLLEDNKDKGAFYTPKEIVHYMCQESLIEYLCTKCKTEFNEGLRDGLERFIKNQETNGIADYKEAILVALRNVKICDPAIGSGAFPMGILLEIFHAVEVLYAATPETTERIWNLNDKWNPAKVKLSIIENSIYGVDLEPGAVDIARLRFWLSLVVDEEKPQPLPNLDYKIMQGNSLLESFEDIDLCVHLENDDELFPDLNKFSVNDVIRLKSQVKKYFKADTPSKKAILQQTISQVIGKFISERINEKQKKNDEALQIASDNLVLEGRRTPATEALRTQQQENLKKLRLALEKLIKESGHIQDLQKELLLMQQTKVYPYFLWHLWFSDIFDDGGFDIVIGNPPYLRIQGIRDVNPAFANELVKRYKSATGSFDLYTTFLEKGLSIISKFGVVNYIMPVKWTNAAFGTGLREVISETNSAYKIINFGSYQVFNASTYTGLQWFKRDSGCLHYFELNKDLKSKEELTDYINSLSNKSASNIPANKLTKDSWVLSVGKTTEILNKLNQHTRRMSDIFEKIFQGLATSKDDVYFLYDCISEENYVTGFSKQLNTFVKVERAFTKPLLKGEDVHRYESIKTDRVVIFPYKLSDETAQLYKEEEIQNNFPLAYSYLKECEEILRDREKGRLKNDNFWYRYIYPKNLVLFKQKKLMAPEISLGGNYSCDEKGEFYSTTTIYGYVKKSDTNESYKFLLGIMNSQLLWWYLVNTGAVLANGYFRYKPNYIKPFPFPAVIPVKTQRQIEKLVDSISLLRDNSTSNNCSELEDSMNKIIYDLYALTSEEVDWIKSMQ
ncbi:Eco57I restriction-modification methylase domain-containing protein [Mucilaginibacter sp.]|uniref:Eco57I restriction-modification methylase domain-containing protein n=1 Tax=Mucilaginibacter sp. TaxID=1882438 RepID=UPI002849FF09|nr:TaqI-like C-terminal specificity domain-containing protein [Mucilaginibacter sp.]MDR3694549.1 TaqI-like C-terminal specificity domain-containing protein [Mucilaginibacter sp.]